MQDQGGAQLSSPLRIYRGSANDLNVTHGMFLLRMHDKETTLLIKPDRVVRHRTFDLYVEYLVLSHKCSNVLRVSAAISRHPASDFDLGTCFSGQDLSCLGFIIVGYCEWYGWFDLKRICQMRHGHLRREFVNGYPSALVCRA